MDRRECIKRLKAVASLFDKACWTNDLPSNTVYNQSFSIQFKKREILVAKFLHKKSKADLYRLQGDLLARPCTYEQLIRRVTNHLAIQKELEND